MIQVRATEVAILKTFLFYYIGNVLSMVPFFTCWFCLRLLSENDDTDQQSSPIEILIRPSHIVRRVSDSEKIYFPKFETPSSSLGIKSRKSDFIINNSN